MYNRITGGRVSADTSSWPASLLDHAGGRISRVRRSLSSRQNASRHTPTGRLRCEGRDRSTLAAIDLEKEPANIKGRELRFRKLTIEPGASYPGTATPIDRDHLHFGR